MVAYDPSKINFLFFGRISKYKGLNVLAEAFEKLSQKRKDCALYVIGNGNFEPYKEKYNALPNCRVINRWIGDDEVAEIFTGKNLVCILPYLDASQSGVALVSMDFGVPVIATATGGLTEQVSNEETGLLIEPNDVDALEKAMERVADNKELYKKLAAGGQAYARSLSWDNTMEKVEKYMRSDIEHDHYENPIPHVFFGGGTDMENFLWRTEEPFSLQHLINTVM